MYVGLILVQVLVLILIHPAAGYNLDQEHSLVFSGPPSSMFGYSVLLHHHTTHNWSVLILIYHCYSPFPLLIHFCCLVLPQNLSLLRYLLNTNLWSFFSFFPPLLLCKPKIEPCRAFHLDVKIRVILVVTLLHI